MWKDINFRIGLISAVFTFSVLLVLPRIPVVVNKKLIGIITDNLIAYKLGSIRKRGVPASRLHASSVTDKSFEAITTETKVETILRKVGEPGPTLLPVVKNEKLVGVVTKADLLPLVSNDKKLAQIMQKKLYMVNPDERIIHARRIMIDKNIARLPVIENGKIIGMISDTEIAFALSEIKRSFPLGKQKHRLDELLVVDIMKTPVIWTDPNISTSDAAKIMIKHNVGALPLINNNKIVGIVTRTDLIKTIPI